MKAMFSPFWDVIAYEAVRNLATKPQTTERMADLLDMSVEEFLIFTQSFSLPYLVLNKHYGVIKRISQARKDDEQWFVCFDTSNLVKILALLLQQNVTDMEDFVMSLLIGFDHKFKENDLTDFMKIEPSTTAYFLLLAAGEADEKVKSRVSRTIVPGLNFLTHSRFYMPLKRLPSVRQVLKEARKRKRVMLVFFLSSIF